MLWSPSTYWTGHDFYYFLATTIMWFLIGLRLDRRLRGKAGEFFPMKTWWIKILASLFVLCGLIVCYSVFPHPYYGPMTGYLSLLGERFAWWYALGVAWGLGLVIAGLRLMFRPGKLARG